MDRMRISGNEPSSVILSQTKWFQKEKMLTQNYQKGWCKKPKNYNFNQLYTENFDAFKTLLINQSRWLKSSLKKFNGRYGDLIKQYEVPLSRMLNDHR